MVQTPFDRPSFKQVSGIKEAVLSEGVPQQPSARVTKEKKKEKKEEEFGKTFCYPCRIKFDSAEVSYPDPLKAQLNISDTSPILTPTPL